MRAQQPFTTHWAARFCRSAQTPVATFSADLVSMSPG